MSHLYSIGLGVGTQNKNQQWLDVFFSMPLLSPSQALVDALMSTLTQLNIDQKETTITLNDDILSAIIANIESINSDESLALTRNAKLLLGATSPRVLVLLKNDSAPNNVPEAYLKLHLLSHRLVKPHGTNLTGIFGILPNVAWTNQGPIDLEELPDRQLAARAKGQLINVDCIDKFPKMSNYVVPTGVRIAHTARVRLGAYIGEGTTIMHEGFVNFNAGTLGTSMIEGRISAGVTVGEGSDLGGGSSTMGTLSGGGNIIISVGKESLIGANAGTGIPLGNRCTIESGLYITAGTKVTLLDDQNEIVSKLKARDLAGKNDLLFRRNSMTGAVECKTNKTAVALNQELHANN